MHNKKSLISLFVFLLLGAVFAGCSQNDDKKPVERDNNLNIPVAGVEDLSGMINDRKGRVLFLNIWATWCAPCIEEFPYLVRLYKKYHDSPVDFLSLSVDIQRDVNSLVIPFIKEQKAEFPVFLAKEDESEEIINLINPDWSGAIPVTVIYDETGRQKKFILGARNFNEFENELKEVLKTN